MAFPVFEYEFDASGAKNGIDVTSATVGADIVAKILASTAVESRLFPTVRVQNPTVTRTDTAYETTANGDRFKLAGEGDIYTFLMEYYGVDGVFQIFREFKKMGCINITMYVATTDGNLWGTKDSVNSGTLYGYKISKETIDSYYSFAVPGAKAKTMVSFDIDRDVCIENSYVITGAEMIASGGVKSTSFSALVSGFQTAVNPTPSNTTISIDVYEGFGTANNRTAIEGLLLANFVITDDPDGTPAVITPTGEPVESPAGTYLFTVPAMTATNTIQSVCTATGYDVATTTTIAS
tara:strand:- start:1652 stop:2533 length:882 start_codon:yes stop_codon:yes gene_type:complete